MEPDQPSDTFVAKTPADFWNHQLDKLLAEIDYLKQSLIREKNNCLFLAERLDALFVKLYPKMNDDDVVKQKEFSKKINSIPIQKFAFVDAEGRFVPPSVNSKKIFIIDEEKLPLFMGLLKERELHLAVVLEKIGLTNPAKPSRRVG